ncbi:MAG TPA: response regulator, partial [Pirellulales bacterium]|nr:response regulator [Pirellulales bacterium]
CEQLKQQMGLRDAPVMYVSSTQVPDIIRRSHAAGGSYYLRKPFHASVLVQLIEKVRLSARPKVAVATARPSSTVDSPKPAGLRAVMDRAGALTTR